MSKAYNFLYETAMLIAVAQANGKAYKADLDHDNFSDTFEECHGRASVLFQDNNAIRDQDVMDFLHNKTFDLLQLRENYDQREELDVCFKKWLGDKLVDTEDFETLPMPSSQKAIIEFLAKHRHRNLRIHQQEYWQKDWFDTIPWEFRYFKTPDDLIGTDIVVLSLPLRGTQTIEQWFIPLLEKCEKLNIPVFLDCAYYWLMDVQNISLKYKCIKEVACSLSKIFPTFTLNAGAKLVRKDRVSKWDTYYTQNRILVDLTMSLCNNFSNDYIVKKYKPLQEKYCKILNVQPVECVTHAKIKSDLYDYNSNKMWEHNGLNQDLLNMSRLYENNELIENYLSSKNFSSS
jgi:hypothetical protein